MSGAGTVKKESGIDLTQGKIFSKLLAFILPIMAANLLQAFYNAADMIVVSLSGEQEAVGAIGTTGTLITLVFSICVSVSIGAKVVIARALGEGDDEAVKRAVRTAVVTGLLFGLLCMGIGLIVAKPALRLLGNKGRLLDLSVSYTRIYMYGVPFVSLTNFFTAILHGEGNSKTPFVVLVISGLINVALNLFFVLVCKMTVDGVALATAVSNGISASILLVILMRENSLWEDIFLLTFDAHVDRPRGRHVRHAFEVGQVLVREAVFLACALLDDAFVVQPSQNFECFAAPLFRGASRGRSQVLEREFIVGELPEKAQEQSGLQARQISRHSRCRHGCHRHQPLFQDSDTGHLFYRLYGTNTGYGRRFQNGCHSGRYIQNG